LKGTQRGNITQGIIVQALLVVSLLLVALWFVPVRVDVTVGLFHGRLALDLEVWPAGLFRVALPVERAVRVGRSLALRLSRRRARTAGGQLISAVRLALKVARTLKYLLLDRGIVRCPELTWYTRIGAGDAARTALWVGLLWGIKGSLVGYLTHVWTFEGEPELVVEPDYDEAGVESRLHCIVKFRLGDIILAAVAWAGSRLLSSMRGARGIWTTIPFKD